MSSCEESEKVGGSFPTLINSMDRQEKKRKKEKKKRRKKKCVKKKKERGKEKIFSVFRRSELDSSRTKVGQRNENYAWVPKSKFFVKVSRGMVFSYIGFLFTKGS